MYPTNELRWLETPFSCTSRVFLPSQKLQQKWINEKGNFEWRAVEIVQNTLDTEHKGTE